MKNNLNILFICGRNKRRSRTAESIFRKEQGFTIRSAGLSPKSPSQISDSKIEWADAMMVMEDGHMARILGQYRHIHLPPIFVLHIEDEYAYMQPELVELLKSRIPDTIKYEIRNHE